MEKNFGSTKRNELVINTRNIVIWAGKYKKEIFTKYAIVINNVIRLFSLLDVIFKISDNLINRRSICKYYL